MTSYQPLELLSIPLKGTHLIEASAGTGKTFTISHLYLRLLLEEQLDVRSILVVTFTEAATKELIERIRHNLFEAYQLCHHQSEEEDALLREIINQAEEKLPAQGVSRLLRQAIIRFDEASIFTIHGFCRRILSDYSFETSILFDTELVSDQSELIQEVVDDFWRIWFSDKPPFLTQLALNNDSGPSGLTDLAGMLLRMPTAVLSPPPDPSSSEKAEIRLEAIKAEWLASRDQIQQILLEDKGLKRDRSSFPEDQLKICFAALDQLVKGEYASQWLDAISRFSQDTINASMKKKHEPPGHPFFENCRAFTNLTKEILVWLKHAFANYLKAELRTRKADRNIQSFDDLLSKVHRVLTEPTRSASLADAVRRMFRAALVDEFQDTDPIQYDIFKTLFMGHHALYMIGDPKQSIYAFRGADLFSYLEAARQVQSAHRFTLETNWRSETGMVSAVNRVFSEIKNPFVLGEAIPFRPVRSTEQSRGNRSILTLQDQQAANLVLWHITPSETKPPNKEDAAEWAIDWTVNEIQRLLALSGKGQAKLGDRPLRPADVAILVLKNDDAQRLKDRLSALHIPAVLTKSGNVFHSREAHELHLFLLAVSRLRQSRALNTALATETMGFTAEQIRAFNEDPAALDDYEWHINRFSEYRDLWSGKGFMPMFRKWLADYRIRERLVSYPAGDRKLTNLLHLSELLHQQSIEKEPGINGLIGWLEEQRASERTQEEWELRLERDDEAVQILTVFKSKGLQFPIVFCPFMWQRGAAKVMNAFSYHQNGELLLQIGTHTNGKDGLDQARLEQLSDLMRLFYVALTRAQNRCYLALGRIGKPAANALDYLLAGGKDPTPSIVADLQSEISTLSPDDYLQTARRRLNLPDEIIELVSTEPDRSMNWQPEEELTEQSLELSLYSRQNRWMKEWGIVSYSGIVAGEDTPYQEDELLLADEMPEPVAPAIEKNEEAFFSFPAGRTAGTCIHHIFEQLDFTQSLTDQTRVMIRQALLRFGILESTDKEPGQEPLVVQTGKMIERVLSAPLLSHPDIRLKDVSSDQKIVELAFHYPISRLSPERLRQLIKEGSADDTGARLDMERLEHLSFVPVSGFMHGFIDLVFEQRGKFYILDWKSNQLGQRYADYTPERLEQVMRSHFYDLQYLIYSVALDQFLRSRLPDYSYETHFGGVFYLFVRGVDPGFAGNGIFFDLPSENLIRSLSKMLAEQDV